MKHRILVVVSCFAALAASLPVQAQVAGQDMAFSVAFDFTLNGQVFQAGKYFVQPNGKEANGLAIYELSSSALGSRADKSKFRMELTAITRLARQHMDDAPQATLVFDKAGERRTLTEIWLPGQDGYLVDSTKAEHQHDVVPVVE